MSKYALIIFLIVTMFSAIQAENVIPWDEFDTKVNKLIESEQNTQAIQLLKESIKDYPSKEFEIYSNLINLYNALGEIRNSIGIMSEANNKGFYFWFMPRESRYNNFRRESWFIKALSVNNALRDKTQKSTKPLYEIILPKEFDAKKQYPLILIMHGGNQSIMLSKDRWKSDDLYTDKIVAFVQSGWTVATNRFRWNLSGIDLFHGGTAIDEVKSLYNEISAKYSKNIDKIILVGFSQGASLAMNMAIYKDIDCVGVLAGCPFNDDINQEHALDLKNRDVRFFVFSGDQDWAFAKAEKNMSILKESGVKTIFKINKDVGHQFSKDIETDIKNALELLLEN